MIKTKLKFSPQLMHRAAPMPFYCLSPSLIGFAQLAVPISARRFCAFQVAVCNAANTSPIPLPWNACHTETSQAPISYDQEALDFLKHLCNQYPLLRPYERYSFENDVRNELTAFIRSDPSSKEFLSSLLVSNLSSKGVVFIDCVVPVIARELRIPEEAVLIMAVKHATLQGDFPSEFLIEVIKDQKAVTDLLTMAGRRLPLSKVTTILDYDELDSHQMLEILESVAGGTDPMLRECIVACKNRIFKSHNPEIQKQQASWLIKFVSKYDKRPILRTILKDPSFSSLLCEVCALRNSSLQKNAGDVLLLHWKAGLHLSQSLPKLATHQVLPALFLTASGIDQKIASECLASLQPRVYKNGQVILPLIEAINCIQSQNFNTQEKEEIFQFLLKAPLKKKGQKDQDYIRELEIFRNNQRQLCPIICILIAKNCEMLKNFQGSKEILFQRFREALHGLLGISFTSEEEVERCLEIFFLSSRHPGGLFIYAKGLHKLSSEGTSPHIHLLGRFVRAAIDGTFPSMRYQLENNPHLQAVFGQNPSLLRLWRDSIPPISISSQPLTQAESPQALTSRLILGAIQNNHLGNDQQEEYPILSLLKSSKWSPGLIDQVKSKRNDPPTDAQKIELACLEILNPDINSDALKVALEHLKSIVPKELEFRRDIQGILGQMQRNNLPASRWQVLDSDDIDDLLLSGTEVSNSCQHIGGNPNLNKCLLATLCNGQTKVMIVKDPSGRILARSTMRVLQNQRTREPVLFIDRIYTSINDQNLFKAIIEGSIAKAKQMGLPLVTSSSGDNLLRFQDTLQSFKGIAPDEYVDAAGGIKNYGYIIQNQLFVIDQSSFFP
ncbi:MAG TPA: hypothetical protein VLE96_01125 [Chlamydiales bacterium]|nr:hypothetical protein [Chlamydiales bacterium]